MATVWLTYAWADNSDQDADFVAQELIRAGLQVKIDRWNLSAGKRLWEQIEHFICNAAECDGWVLYATPNSLGSEACREEFAYALDRALRARGGTFPVIGLFPATVDPALIPAAIRTRLYVSLTDPNWKERIKAAAESRAPNIPLSELAPYLLRVHSNPQGAPQPYSIEVRPRAGTWSPFLAGVPLSERAGVNPSIMFGASGRVPFAGALFATGSGPSDDQNWWLMFAQNEATPTQSYFIHCKQLPSKLLFGVNGGQPQYVVPLNKESTKQ